MTRHGMAWPTITWPELNSLWREEAMIPSSVFPISNIPRRESWPFLVLVFKHVEELMGKLFWDIIIWICYVCNVIVCLLCCFGRWLLSQCESGLLASYWSGLSIQPSHWPRTGWCCLCVIPGNIGSFSIWCSDDLLTLASVWLSVIILIRFDRATANQRTERVFFDQY